MKLPESADQVLRLLADPDTLNLAPPPEVHDDPIGWTQPHIYAHRLKEMRRKTGQHCAIAWGHARIDRQPAILAASDMRFMGGSIGIAEATALSACFGAAVDEKLPVIWIARGGGARVHEGTFALAAVARILAARNSLADAGVPYIAVAADPLAAGCTICAMQADVVLGVEGAYIGFAGQKVVQQFDKDSLPEGFQTAEYALATGQLDLVLRSDDLRPALSFLLGVLAPGQPQQAASPTAPSPGNLADTDPWQLVQRARSDDKPSTREVIAGAFDAFFELRGDRVSSDDPAIVAGLARIAGQPVAVIGHDAMRSPEEKILHNFAMTHAAGHRKALRIVRLAERLRLPIVTFVDTPGAYPNVRSESEGQAGTMGQLLCELLAARVPTCAVILGQGSSGGAMALATADRVLMTDASYYTAISPEGAAAILWKDVEKTAEASAALKLTPGDLARAGLVDGVLPGGPACRDTASQVRKAVTCWLAEPRGTRQRIRLQDRAPEHR